MSYGMREPPIQPGYYGGPGPPPQRIPPLVLVLAVIGGMTVLSFCGGILMVPISIARSLHAPRRPDPWAPIVNRSRQNSSLERVKKNMEDMKQRSAETHARLEQMRQQGEQRLEEMRRNSDEMRRNSQERMQQLNADMQRQQQELHQQLEQTREMTRAVNPNIRRLGAAP